jgi:hypothetical protein
MELMPIRPQPGEILFYMSPEDIENMTVMEALTLVDSLGFTPEFRYRTWEQDGQQHTKLYVLIYCEKREYESSLEADFMSAEQEILATRIKPTSAVHFSYCLKYGRETAIASESVATAA